MIVCESGDQAKGLHKAITSLGSGLSAALVLHDVDGKESRKISQEEFKRGRVDLLVVYNMLLTGFDSSRLKKLYLLRIVKGHNLLQTLTRVNRPYKQFKHGYVVDFADMRETFDKTSAMYFKELEDEIGEDWDKCSNLFKSEEEMSREIELVKERLFRYDTTNAETFCDQVSAIKDKAELIEVVRALESAATLGNLASHGHRNLSDRIDFRKLRALLGEARNRLALLDQKEALESGALDMAHINAALEDVVFEFAKVGESELRLGAAFELWELARRIREALEANFDEADLSFRALRGQLEEFFKTSGPGGLPGEAANRSESFLKAILDGVEELNRRNGMLLEKYKNDEKFARIHKRLVEEAAYGWENKQEPLFQALMGIKERSDFKLSQNNAILGNEAYFAQYIQPVIFSEFKKAGLILHASAAKMVDSLIVDEYVRQFQAQSCAKRLRSACFGLFWA
jgi:type I restriction enzyme R subunit